MTNKSIKGEFSREVNDKLRGKIYEIFTAELHYAVYNNIYVAVHEKINDKIDIVLYRQYL